MAFRRALLRAATVVLSLVSCTAAGRGDDVNPVPSNQLCDNGKPRIVWQYGNNAPLPSNATPVACGSGNTCYVVPEGACLQMVEVHQTVHSSDLPQVKTGDAPEEPGSHTVPPPAREPPAPVKNAPTAPYPVDVVPLPERDCVAGKGWDFENTTQATLPLRAEFDKWEADTNSGSPFAGIVNADLTLPGAPVYGDAAPIDQIRPPGWSAQIASSIGGDYWLYSQSVNQHGRFWLSSKYRRYSWGQQPGATWSEQAIGMLQSPACVLGAKFLTFRMSGGRSSSQRIEVDVKGGHPQQYFGIRFPGSVGDNSSAYGGQFGHAAQVVSVPTVPQKFPPLTSGWTTERSVTSEDGTESDWMQVYVFNLSDFVGKPIRIRVIDDSRSDCATAVNGTCTSYRQEHINADDFRFADSAPAGVRWITKGEIETHFCDRNTKCQQVGVVDSAPPLWGFTDAHAHPMANLAFGGHVLWGDVTDKLEDIYDCSRPLPAIPGPGGRAAIAEPASTSTCYIAGDIDFIVTGTASMVGCSALAVVPFIGIGVASVCKSVLAVASVTLLTTPVVTGLRLHGGNKLASGAVLLGPMFTQSWLGLEKLMGEHSFLALLSPSGPVNPTAFATGLIPETDSWSSTKPQLSWYPADESWHSYTGLGRTHTRYQTLMIRRAFEGGMRLGVWDVVNSRALAFAADGNEHASDWQALKDQTDAAKRIIATSLSDIAVLALTPQQADAIVRSGKMAIILGSEVDELGRMRPDGLPWPRSPHTSGDTMEKQVSDLFELGIRKVTPVHAVNNPIGGPAVFVGQYVANDHFVNGTPVDGEPSFFDLPPVRFVLDRSIAGTLFKIVLGKLKLLAEIGGDGKTPWNPQGWFELAGTPSQLDGIIDGYDLITYRIGQDSPKDKDGNGLNQLTNPDGSWRAPPDVLGNQVIIAHAITDLSTWVRPSGGCDMYNTVMPKFATNFGSVVDAEFTAVNGHRNKLGLFRTPDHQQDGETFIRALMKRGMLLDVDHMSQHMRLDVYALAAKYATEAGRAACSSSSTQCGDYPVMGVHTSVREFEKEGSNLPHLIDHFGSNDESTRTAKEIEYVGARGGAVGVFPRPTFIPPFSLAASRAPSAFAIPQEVQNDCDGSSKTFAIKYLFLMSRMHGHGLTMTTDFNGLQGTAYPRYGRSIPGKFGCGHDGRSKSLPGTNWAELMATSQEVESSGVWYSDYATRAPVESHWAVAKNWIDPKRPAPNRRWKEVVARAQGEAREDRAPRFSTYRDGSAIQDRVYYDDFGADNHFLKWDDQSGNRPGAQMFAMQRWHKLHSGWDFNLDGFQHIGLAPDMLQDMRNVGVQWEQMEPLMHGAADLISTWQKSTDLGAAHP